MFDFRLRHPRSEQLEMRPRNASGARQQGENDRNDNEGRKQSTKAKSSA